MMKMILVPTKMRACKKIMFLNHEGNITVTTNEEMVKNILLLNDRSIVSSEINEGAILTFKTIEVVRLPNNIDTHSISYDVDNNTDDSIAEFLQDEMEKLIHEGAFIEA